MIIPKHFFTPNIIKKRNPLSAKAKRAGWIGCNIDLKGIPQDGKIYIIQNKVEIPKSTVLKNMKKNTYLMKKDINQRGWILDVMKCIEQLNKEEFNLSEIYKFKEDLSKLHPKNNNIEAKMRQQLQILRDNKYLEFLGNGKYKRLR